MSRALPIADPFCADTAEAMKEPLAGTAAHARAWILVEEPGIWDRDPIASAGIAGERAVIEGWLTAIPKSRLQLVRRPRTSGATTRRVMLALPGEGRVLAWSVESLARVPMIEAARGDAVEAERLDVPLHLVCTHGKRDRCCALRGMPIFHALAAAGADVWQTSHLGGHRFAATSVRFPDGYAFGYLTVEHVASLLDEAVPLEIARGRVSLDEPSQAAELALRRALGLRRPNEVAHVATERTESGWRARFSARASGESLTLEADAPEPTPHVLDVRKTTLEGARPKSCGDAPSAIDTFVVSFDEALAAAARGARVAESARPELDDRTDPARKAPHDS
ncbi:MAG: hypothetical protein MUE69_24215 [Myxococcota bacterium]|jgi:hypothetical protein|nr:hypothetical protein [Myxococcota bacterium]